MDCDLRLGHWSEALEGEAVDSLICDPPYSERTHKGQRSAKKKESAITYESISTAEISEFVGSWVPRVRRWFVVFGDHISCSQWLDAFEAAGLLTFAPVVWVKQGAAPRFSGDGPACAVEWIAVARTRHQFHPREFGSRPGKYSGPLEKDGIVMGQKPLWLMRALIRDYSLPGQRVADPFAGSGTTLLAARAEGRKSVGAEKDPERYEKAAERIAEPWQVSLFRRFGND